MFVLAGALAIAVAPACRTSGESAAQPLIQRAIAAVGLPSTVGSARVSMGKHVFNMKYQSDRMYPPYLWMGFDTKVVMDWETGALRVERGTAPQTMAYLSDSARRSVMTARGTMLMPATNTTTSIDERAMDPWTVLAEWRSASDAKPAGECMYRDYWRSVVTRTTSLGTERLFLDTKTGVPVKLERREPHMLWGDVLVEYLWSIWTPVKGASAIAPQFAFRMVDGEIDDQRTFDSYAMVPRDSAGVLAIPASAIAQPARAATSPDTVRVSATTFLLVTPQYTNVVTLQRDTVFILDAQTDQQRAARDSAWIGKLFPGVHPIVLVVTDLAWPHIAGVRYWVANGAAIVSHRASRDFLTEVVNRKWTMAPDLLEQRRKTARLRFRAVDSAFTLGNGALELRPIDGVGSEGALMAYLPKEEFLYAGDYVQGGGPGSFSATYAREVAAAVRRSSFTPKRFAAMHVGLTDWINLPRFTGIP